MTNESLLSKNKFKLFIFFIYIIIIVLTEKLYHEYLFNKSIEIEKKIYENSSKQTIKFYKIITHFGSKNIIIPIFILIIIFFPINISYTFLSIIILSTYYTNILKLLYGSPRPFWINPSIKKLCDCGFGNPSGHSFAAFSFYLSLWNLIIEIPFFSKKKYFKIIFFIFFIILSFFISISRIYLSMHSFNQIIYGALLGIGLYFYFFHIIQLHKYSGKKFFKYIIGSFESKIHLIKYILYILILFLLYRFKKNNWKKYNYILNNICPQFPDYRKFNKDGLYVGLIIFLLIGAHYGLFFFIYIIQKQKQFNYEEINNWNKGNNIKLLFYKFLIFIPHILPIIIYFIIPNNLSIIIIYSIKVIFSFFITGILAFGLYFYICIQFRIAYKNIYLFNNFNEEEINNNSIQIKVKKENNIFK